MHEKYGAIIADYLRITARAVLRHCGTYLVPILAKFFKFRINGGAIKFYVGHLVVLRSVIEF